MNQEVTEKDLIQKSKAPRVTMQAIEDAIIAEHYFTAYEGRMGSVIEGTYETKGTKAGTDLDLGSLKLLTFCVLVLDNGFTVHGVSACASPENFDREIGQSIARKNAFDQIWPLMGYELKTRLHHQEQMEQEDALGKALTMLLAHSFGNTGALSSADAGIILSELIPQNVESNEAQAKICYEAYRSWLQLNDDDSWVPWEEAAPDIKEETLNWVRYFRSDAGELTADSFMEKLFQSIVKSASSPVTTPASQRQKHLKLV